MIIMSVDVGAARTGIAICDKNEILASPLKTITEYNRDMLIKKVAQTAIETKSEHIVVGLPRNMDGSEGEKALCCRDFAEKLFNELGGKINVSLSDERVSTVLAHTYMNMGDVRGKKRKDNIDALSAVIILENFISERKNKKGGAL